MSQLKRKIDYYFNCLISLSDKKINKLPNPVKKFLIFSQIKLQLKKESKKHSIQLPLAKKTNRHASQIIKYLADYMPNNAGNWTVEEPHSISTKLEKQLVEKIKEYLYCGNNKQIIGYISSGSTEGNIYAAWLGKKYLAKKLQLDSPANMVLLISSLGHYSLQKVADIFDLKTKELAIDKDQWNINLDYLEKTITNLYKKGIKAFLLPLTLGYTITGTDDNVKKICQIMVNFRKKHNDIDFFIWIDAAFSGISKIFLEKDFQPFKNKNIQLITMDFHKLLAAPYSSGIILYRKPLLNLIKTKKVVYTNQFDLTLLGSRSGLNVIATWMIFKNYNKNQLQKIFKKALSRKEFFLQKIKRNNEGLEIINNPSSLQACLVQNSHTQKNQIKNIIFHSYKLFFPSGYKIIKMAKLYFFQQF